MVFVAWAQLACGTPSDGTPMPVAATELASGFEHQAELHLSFRNRPVGLVRERLHAAADGYRFERSEFWRARRDHVLTGGTVRTIIDTDRQLRAHRIVFEAGTGQISRAEMRAGQWHIQRPGLPDYRVPATAQPIELLHLQMARSNSDAHSGPVLLPGLSFAVAHAEVGSIDRLERQLVLSGRGLSARTRIELADDGSVVRIVGPDITMAATAQPPDMVPDLIADSSIAIAGQPGPILELALTEAAAVPPALAEMAVAVGSSWHIDLRARAAAPIYVDPTAEPDPPLAASIARLSRRLPGADTGELGPLAASIGELITGDLRPGPSTAAQIARDGRGDCVAHALLFADLARARGHRPHLVTGLLLDQGRLVRHAWVQVDSDRGTIAFDPTTGEAPITAPGHIPLAVHSSAASEIALAAELAFAPLAGARAQFIARPNDRSTVRSP